VDDVVDECGRSATGARQARLVARRTGRHLRGQAEPSGDPARSPKAIRDFNGLPQELLAEIIDGMEMDLTHNRYADFKALHLYCYRVASVVGLLAAEIFGYEDRHTLKYAHDLGLAFQLTNIIRDVGEDARAAASTCRRRRARALRRRREDILHARTSDAFRRLMEFQIDRAEAYYEQAFAQLPAQDRRAQRPGLVMAAIYRTLLREIRRDGCRVLDRRMALTPIRKLWIAWRTWNKG
jgi:phytoene synthase